jgi:hypothetical protein
MIEFYVDGAKAGNLVENMELLIRFLEGNQTVEFRSPDGRSLGEFRPSRSAEVPWNPTITVAELDRRATEPGGMTLGEFWKRMGVR